MTKTLKDIPWYEWLYSVTTDGKVWSYPKKARWALHNWKFLKPWITDGYEFVSLSKNKKIKNWRVHRLVLITYSSNSNHLPIINHKNGIRTDNRIENLEWCTVLYNNRHWWERWRKNTLWKSVMQLTKEGILCKIYESCAEAGRANWLNFQSISQCALWKIKSCWWYNWEYLTIK